MAKRTCSVEGCERDHCARGFCKMHWKKWRREGGIVRGEAAPAEATAE